jgi:ribosome-associated toxin RatA of RatAB toxin-antitoxin module
MPSWLSPLSFTHVAEPAPATKRVGGLASWISPLLFTTIEEPLPVAENAGVLASWLSPLMGARSDLEEEESTSAVSDDTREELEADDTKGDSPWVSSVQSSIIIDAPPQAVFDAATAYEEYPQWTGGCTQAKVVSRQTNSLAREVDFTMGAFGVTSQNIMQYEYDSPHRMKWNVVKGSVRKLVGEYFFTALPGGRTEVVYKLKVDPGVPMPKILRDATAKVVASAALSDLKRWVERQSSDVALPAASGASPLEVHHEAGGAAPAAAFRELFLPI